MGMKPAYDASDWASLEKTKTLASRAGSYRHLFTKKVLDPELDPRNIRMREIRNSATNPVTTPMLVGIDTSGSMGNIAFSIAKEGMEVFAKEVYGRKAAPGPQLAIAGIGDLIYDNFPNYVPFQVTQFEPDIKVLEQLLGFSGFSGGGGNNFESYNALWHFGAYHTSADAWEKDFRRGYMFTVGDETCPPDLTEANLVAMYGPDRQEILATNSHILQRLARMYDVYHIVIAEGSYARTHGANKVANTFTPLLGQNVLILDDYTKLSELIISTIQIAEGVPKEEVIKSWTGKTSVVVAKALEGAVTGETALGGITRF